MDTGHEKPAQQYTVPYCYDETTEHRSATVTVTRLDERDNMVSLTVDDGQGSRTTVVLGGSAALMHMAHMGAVAVHC